jgi:hypothetical protein
MTNQSTEIFRIGGDSFLKLVLGEFPNGFDIISRTLTEVVVGDKIQNVKFSVKKGSIVEKYVFEKTRGITRK